MGKYALSEIWHTLFIREKLFLTHRWFSSTRHMLFGQQVLGSVRRKKDHFWTQVPLLVWRPFWLWYLLTLSSTSFHCPSLFPFLSPHIHSVYWPPQMWESVSLYVFLFMFSSSCCSWWKLPENTHQLSLLPRLALMFP